MFELFVIIKLDLWSHYFTIICAELSSVPHMSNLTVIESERVSFVRFWVVIMTNGCSDDSDVELNPDEYVELIIS